MKYLLLGFRVELKYQSLINFWFNSQVLQSAKEQLKWSLLKWGSWDLFGIEHIQILENMRKLTSFIHRKTENNTRTIFLVKFFCSLPKIDWSIFDIPGVYSSGNINTRVSTCFPWSEQAPKFNLKTCDSARNNPISHLDELTLMKERRHLYECAITRFLY